MRQFIARIFISTHATAVTVIPNIAKLDKAMSWAQCRVYAGCRLSVQ